VRASTRKLILSTAAAVALLVSSAVVNARDPVTLTDGQLDRVTAGAAAVFSNTDAQALAAYRVITTTSSNSIYGSNQGVEDGFGSEGGLATGVAVAFGTNGANRSAPPPSSSTNVTTGGAAEGNFRVTITGGGTVSALGMTIQSSMTAVYGAVVPGL
jgi:hypothetical protein